MRFTHILIAYFVIASVMFGSGVITWEEAGIGSYFVDVEGDGVQRGSGAQEDLEGMGGPIQAVAQVLGAGVVLAIWQAVSQVLGVLFWPVTVMLNVNAPPRLVILFGGVPTVGFWGGMLRLIRGSA